VLTHEAAGGEAISDERTVSGDALPPIAATLVVRRS